MTWLRHVRFSGVPGKMTRRLASIVLAGLAMTVFFGGLVARQLELTQGGDADRANLLLAGACVLAVLAVVAAGTLRRPWGLTLGWVVLGLTALSTIVLTAMGIVTVLFGALWVLALVQGPKMEEMTRAWIAEHGNVHPDERVPDPDPTDPTDPTERTEREDTT